MGEVSIIGLDLAKNSFQLHGVGLDGKVDFRKKLGRSKVLGFLAEQSRCLAAMEACASAHYCARETGALEPQLGPLSPCSWVIPTLASPSSPRCRKTR